MLSGVIETKKPGKSATAGGASGATLRPVNIDCLLKASKRQQLEPAYRRALCDAVFEQLMHALHALASRLACPELCVAPVERVCIELW